MFKSRNSESLGNYYRKTAGVKGDREIEDWLAEPEQVNTYLESYKEDYTDKKIEIGKHISAILKESRNSSYS